MTATGTGIPPNAAPSVDGAAPTACPPPEQSAATASEQPAMTWVATSTTRAVQADPRRSMRRNSFDMTTIILQMNKCGILTYMVDVSVVKRLLYLAWSMPLLRLAKGSGMYDVVLQDVRRWHDRLGWREDRSDAARFAALVGAFPEFRNLVHYRISGLPAPLRLAARAIWRKEKTLHIHCDSIGPGLFIQHGFATTITARSIGRDCWINQQVTIGHTTKGQPVIGDRVRISAGAVVVGPINVGDDATIGVNATVVTSVPSGATMVAPQAQQLPSADTASQHASTTIPEKL